MNSTEVKHCTIEDIGLEITGEDAPPIIDAINKYLADFAGKVCPKCGSKLGGMFGAFTWGLAHGEGYCTGGFTGKRCGWPARGYHDIKDANGESLFEQRLPIVLAYHPDAVEEGPDVELVEGDDDA